MRLRLGGFCAPNPLSLQRMILIKIYISSNVGDNGREEPQRKETIKGIISRLIIAGAAMGVTRWFFALLTVFLLIVTPLNSFLCLLTLLLNPSSSSMSSFSSSSTSSSSLPRTVSSSLVAPDGSRRVRSPLRLHSGVCLGSSVVFFFFWRVPYLIFWNL